MPVLVKLELQPKQAFRQGRLVAIKRAIPALIVRCEPFVA